MICTNLICLLVASNILADVLGNKMEKIFVNSSKELEKQLQRLLKDVDHLQLTLDSSIEYKLMDKNFRYYINKTLTITSNSDGNIADIQCNEADKTYRYSSTTGIAFINSTVNMTGIRIMRCGIHLTTLPSNITDMFNKSSQLYYRSKHAATLLFIHCQVNMRMVEIKFSNGFAILGYNLIMSEFNFVKVGDSTKQFAVPIQGDGSGIMLHYSNSKQQMKLPSVSLTDVMFVNNTDFFKGRACSTTQFIYMNSSYIYQIYNAGGLTIISTQTTYKAHVSVNSARFYRNTASYCGGILIMYFQTNVTSRVLLRNVEFQYNAKFSYRKCHGVALQFIWLGLISPSSVADAISMENIKFNGGNANKDDRRQYGAMYIGIFSLHLKIAFYFKNISWTDNVNRGTGGTCLTVHLYKHYSGLSSWVNITVDTVRAINNTNTLGYSTASNLFHFQNIQNVTFKGNGSFINNIGSVISAEESNVFLHGKMTFTNNVGENGGCIRMEGNGILYFLEDLTAFFFNNRAYISGGALYINSKSIMKCAIQLFSPNISFISNYGKTAGNSIFAKPITLCLIGKSYKNTWRYYYEKQFHLHNKTQAKNSLLQLSTIPNTFTLYTEVKGKYTIVRTPLSSKYPGESIFLKIKVFDLDYKNVFSYINVEVSERNQYETQPLWLKISGGKALVLEGKNETAINITIHTQLPTIHDIVLVFSITNAHSKAYKATLLPCPIGFALDQTSGSCECAHVVNQIQQGTQCNIDQRIISIPNRNNMWIGNISNETAISTKCPLLYCNNDPYYRYILSTDNGMMLTHNNNHDPVSQCLHNRAGLLCGQCNKTGGYSLVLGSRECRRCSNGNYYFLLAAIIQIVSGLVLILLIFIFRLTLTVGTLNGMIFYAQVANAGLLEHISFSNHETKQVIKIIRTICSFFLRMLNLDVGISLCSFEGMDQLWQTGLSLVYPVYLLVIVVTIIIVSHYSTWFSNKTSHSSIQVLVTIVHLSFSKMLLALIDVFTPATIQTTKDTYLVWYWDGSVKYMGLAHTPLVIVTTLTVSILIVPYIGLLLFGKLLTHRFKRASFYLRPILEAVHAPYKDNRQYWFVAKLLLVVIIYLMYVSLGTPSDEIRNIGILFFLSIFLIGQALFQPFKSKLLNILDCWLMFNITLVYVTLWSSVSSVSRVVNIVAVVLAIITFGGIIVYHMSLSINCLKKLQKKIGNAEVLRLFKRENVFNLEERPLEITDSFYGTLTGYREPLTSSININ